MRLALLIVLLFASTSARADPVTAAIATFAAWAVTTAGVITIASVLLSVGTAVYGAAQARRAARDARNATNAAMQDRMATKIASESPHRYIYGRARVGSDIVAMFTSGDKDQYKHIVCVLAAHECDAIEEVYVNNVAVGSLSSSGDATGGRFARDVDTDVIDESHTGPVFNINKMPIDGSVVVFRGYGADMEEVEIISQDGRHITTNYSGMVTVNYQYGAARRFGEAVDPTVTTLVTPYVRVQKHLGTPTDPADGYLMSVVPSKWSSTAVLRGRCYIVVTLDLNNPEFQNGQVPIQALVRGRKLYDPRTGTTAWSSNPALAVRDYLISPICGVPVTDLPDAQFITAANVCDEAVVAGGPRYTINGTVTSDQDQAHVLEAMAQCMAGGIVSTSWDIYAGKYIAPVMALDQTDIVGGVSITPGASDAAIYNGVKGQYLSDENGYVLTDFKPYQNDTYRAADGRDLYTNIDFPFTNTVQRVTNLARIFTEDMRNGFTVKAEFSLKAWPLKVGQRLTFTSAFFGQAAKVYRITDKSFSPNSAVELTMKEDDASIWDFADAVVLDSTPNTNLPDPWLIDSLASIACTSGVATLLKQADGTIVPRILVTWPVVSTQAVFTNGEIEIEWRAIGTDTWQKTKVSGSYTAAYLSPITPGWFYVVRARTVNPYLNTKSDWTTTTYQVAVVSATATVYTWSVGFPTPPTGTASLDWATGLFGAAPFGWSLTEPAAPGTNSTKWAATVSISDITDTAPTAFDWSSATIASIGFTAPGGTLYTWVKYGTSSTGAGLTDSPDGMAYIGFAYNKASPTESTNPADYAWSLIRGTDGTPVKGDPGVDGTTYYTWVKYSDFADGTGLYDTPTSSTLYLGLAVNKTSPTESTLKTDYTWSKFKGDQGVPGTNGTNGANGTNGSNGADGSRGAGTYYATGSSWSATVADAATPGANVVDDLVTISNGTTYTLTRRWNGSAWVDIGTVLDGNLLVTGTVKSTAVDTRGLALRDLSGNIVLGYNVPLDPALAAEGTKNSAISIGANGALSNAGGGQVTLPGMGQNSYRVTANGNSATTGPLAGFMVNGQPDYGANTSYNLIVIRRSDGVVVIRGTYNVLNDPAAPAALANVLNNCDSTLIAVVYTADEPRNNRLNSGLDAAMYRCGASRSVFGSPNFRYRGAFILVGICGCGEGNGAEVYQGSIDYDTNAWCDMGFSIVKGALTGVSTTSTPRTLTDYGYTGDYDATKGSPTGTMVGGTDAGLVASRALNGDTAYNAVNDPTNGLATKLRANAVNVLSGGGAVTIGTLTVDSSGNRTGGKGLGLTAKGIAAYNPSGTATIVLDATTGDATFAGTVTSAAVIAGTVAATLVGNAAQGAAAQTTLSTPITGGTLASQSKTSGGTSIIFDPRTAVGAGGIGPYRYDWSLDGDVKGQLDPNYGIYIYSGGNTATVALRAIAQSSSFPSFAVTATCAITDLGSGRIGYASFDAVANFI